ncbi:hypothetical protein J416_06343 [Gracilibacillus halophilus YIM-C55.5]|uniref:Endolytic murein transglycosylase n=1 Tax=Gracilibacillus halophilus YIM-C55.5 TaxID=1308866 RepID=N4WEF1_9BACI|nr:endolytic transglycosylase MltG [Gracilibacillus halophilus]ENH97609.1 hypothetical protein J416_06343 [Gracilibacillus halophilus YIM-C55.5]
MTSDKKDSPIKNFFKTTYEKYKAIAKERKKEISKARKFIIVMLIVFTLIVVIGGYSSYRYIKAGLSPVDPDSSENIDITIPLGSGTSEIAAILEENGLIQNSMIYRFYVKFNNSAQFQAGDYSLSPSMTLKEITNELETGTVQEEPVFRVTVPEGNHVREIASIYQEEANIDQEAFLERVNDKEYVKSLMDRYPDLLSDQILNEDIRMPLEGYLYPATYQFYEENPSIDTIVTKMLDKSRDVLMSYADQIEESQFNMHEVITFASLVEEEARSEEDRALIASVFYNRMDQDMMLQTDPTVIYAHGEHMERLNYANYEIESPYNTYQVMGLPVGPIANFGESSLQATLNPESSPYLFFLADSEGNVHYARTYEEHQQLEDKYIHNE